MLPKFLGEQGWTIDDCIACVVLAVRILKVNDYYSCP